MTKLEFQRAYVALKNEIEDTQERYRVLGVPADRFGYPDDRDLQYLHKEMKDLRREWRQAKREAKCK